MEAGEYSVAFECTTRADEKGPASAELAVEQDRRLQRTADSETAYVARRILAAVDPGRGAVVGSKDPCRGGRAAENGPVV